MSESTASRIDRVGREQRREERQRTSTSSGNASSNSVSSTSFISSSSPNESPIAPKTTSHYENRIVSNSEESCCEGAVSTSTFEQENTEGADAVRVITNPGTSPLRQDLCTSTQEIDNKVTEELQEGKNKIQVQDRDHYITDNNIPMDTEKSERIHQRIDQDFSDDETDGASYVPVSSVNVASLSSVNEPSNFMSSHAKNSNTIGIPVGKNGNTSADRFINEAAETLEACSLGEVPQALCEQNSLQRLERSLDANNDWQKDSKRGEESNNAYENRTEKHYQWSRRTLDDESGVAANSSQYSNDVDLGTYNSRRNINLVEVNTGAGHSTASGRKTKNRDSTLVVTDNETIENRIASESSTENQRSQSIEHQNSDEDVPFSLQRTSSLKSVKPKTRRTKLSSSTSQSNIPERSTSPSPSRRNRSNVNNKSKYDTKSSRSVNVVRSTSPSESHGEFGDSESANAMKQNPVQNALGLLPHYNWQATKMTVKERLAFLFNNNILSDVTFVVGRDVQQQRIPAHRFVLSVGSAVFDAMFNRHSSKTGSSAIEEEIELPDVEPASFLALLRFLYSDEVQIGPETVMTTLYTAKKYAVPALEKHCVDFLKRHLCADNAFMLLTQARLFDEPQLAALCLETIDKATPEALAAEGFTDIDIDTLSAVLDRDSLRIKEAKLFSAVLRWSEAECSRQSLPSGSAENKRSVLGRVLRQIRFPLMTVEEFAQGPAQSGILTDRECVSLFLHFTVNPKPPVAFMDIPRCSMTGKEQTVCRFQQIESRWGYSGTSDKIRFIVDRRIFVVGFGLYGSIHGPSEYQVNIQIIHTGSGRLLGSNEISFSSDGTNGTFRVMFKEPIEIQHNTNYTASATLKGLDSHYGTKGLRKVSVECPTGGKVTFQFSYAAGNNNGTSVEDGQIPEIIFYT